MRALREGDIVAERRLGEPGMKQVGAEKVYIPKSVVGKCQAQAMPTTTSRQERKQVAATSPTKRHAILHVTPVQTVPPINNK